jgi:hypothetical protein
MPDKFELAFEQYQDGDDYGIKLDDWDDMMKHVIYQATRHAFKAGWAMAGGELSDQPKQ